MDWVAELLGIWGVALLWWVGLCAAFLILTRVSPCNPGRSWWADQRAAATDFAYWLVMPFVTSVGRVAFLLVGVIVLYGREPSVESFAARGWPVWGQCLAILLIQDVLMYTVHRLFHTRTLWKFHAVHHSPEVVDWTTAARFHPVNAVAEFALADAVVLLMGFSPVALAVLGPINLIVSAMVHANLNWTFGPFRYLLASPVFHRWHHTAEAEGLDKNFASTFPFLDLLFGTFHMPRGRVPEVYGANGETVPRGVIGQTVYPARGGWAWAKRHPLTASTTAAIVIGLGWFGWVKAVEFGERQEQEHQQQLAAATEPTRPPEQLRLSYGRGPATATAVAVNASTNRLVRGLSDGTVVILDATDGREIARSHHRTRVNAVAISPNGAFVVSASGDGTVRVLDGGTGAALRTLNHYGQTPMSVAVSDDGVAATGTAAGVACVWGATGYLTCRRDFAGGPIHSIGVSDGGRTVVLSRQSRVAVWDTTPDAVMECDGPRELVYSVAVRADGRTVAAGCYDGKLFLWELTAPAPIHALTGHTLPIYSVQFSRDGQSLVTAGADKCVKVWDAVRGKLVRQLVGVTEPLFAVSVDGERVLAAGKESLPSVWDGKSEPIIPTSAAAPGR